VAGIDDDAARGWTLMAPPAAYALLLLAVPLATIFAFTFWTQDFLTIERTFTLDNYREAVSDPLYRQLMLRSLLIAGAVTIATVLTAFPVAYFVSFRVRPERKALWIFLITIPFWTSYLIRVFLWKVILGFNGVLNTSLQGLGFIEEPLSFILYNANAVVITLAHAYAPFAILPIYVALEKIDRSLLEASRDLGETTVTTFLRVTLPLSIAGVVAAALIVFIPTIGDYVTPRLVGGPDGLMIANMIQTQFLRLNNAPMGATLAVIAMACVGVVSLAVIVVARRFAGPRT
jgi:spermidine/putrescine transport system permease protein